MALLLSLCMASSCISDSFTTSSADILSFSTDTVNFDTVFTGEGTPTARLKVYNRAKKSINISRIAFKDPDSRFSLNVDGVSNTVFSDVEIRPQDSIFIFIECFIPESQGNAPVLTEDKLQFLTNGVTQEVQVEAYGQNVTRLKALTVTQDMTLTADRPYVVFDSLVVAPGVRLSVDPGANILFHDKAQLIVKGSLQAVGNASGKINFRGDRLDDVLPDVGYDILAGQWTGIRITPESFDNRMEFVDMRSTSQGLRIDSCADLQRSKLLLLNSWLHNSQSSVLTSKYARVDAYGCVFSEAADAAVALYGGIHDFRQCTFSNYYLFSAITQPLLTLYNVLPETNAVNPDPNPLMKAEFLNCIFYGIPGDLEPGDLDGSDVYLRYCSLKSAGTDDAHFTNCLWDTDPLFLTRRQDYYFNYRLEPDSPVAAAGNPAFVTDICRYDMDGIDRLGNGNPTLGAYVCRP